MSYEAQYWMVILSLQALVVSAYMQAVKEGWGTRRAAEVNLDRQGQRNLPFLYHGGVWALIPLNFVIAHLIVRYGPVWNVPVLFVVLIGSTIIGAVLIDQWAIADNSPQATGQVLSSMTRYGQPTIVGLLNTSSMAIVYTTVIMYVFFTQAKLGKAELILVLLAMAVYLPFGLLLPAKVTHGSVHGKAVGQMIAGWILLVIFYFVRMNLLQ